MNSQQIQVAIELQMTIKDNGETEQTTTKATGFLYNRNNMDVLTYDEQTEENGVIKNMLTLQPQKVTIKRSGQVQMHQQFRPGRPSENIFHHAHGGLHMETFTDRLDYQPLNATKQGRLSIDYSVKLNGQEEARSHQLTLAIKQEGTK